jgi:hypothetical protein
MDQLVRWRKTLAARIEIADYRVTLADLEKVAQLRFAASLHKAAAV